MHTKPNPPQKDSEPKSPNNKFAPFIYARSVPLINK